MRSERPARCAAVDVGTNSILLLVVQRIEDGYSVLEELCEVTRIGQGVGQSGYLDKAAISRSLRVLEAYRARVDELGVTAEGLRAVGTSALRDAGNANDFLEPASQLLGCPVEVIEGQREATLTRLGVESDGDLPDDTVIFDIGGGSTEFIQIGRKRQISLDIGTVRLTECFLTADPPLPEEIERLRASVRQQLDAALGGWSASMLVGVAGTVTTLRQVELGLVRHDSVAINRTLLKRSVVRGLCEQFQGVSLKERLAIAGLSPGRADIILAGAELVGLVMDHFGLEETLVSEKGVRWGVVRELVDP